MTAKEIAAITSAINERYRHFDPGGSVQFGIEECVLGITEVLQALDPAFDATDFKHRCFSGREVT
jgi:hypothetical protein